MKVDKPERWKSVVAIAFDWVVMITAILISKAVHNPFVMALCIVIIGCRQHALFILVHEGVHYHLAKSKFLNECLSDYFCAFPVLFDTHAYRTNHLAHHRNLNSEKDPDWVRKVGTKEWTFPVRPQQIALFLPYFIVLRGPWEWGQIAYKFSGFADRKRWSEHPGRLLGKALFYAAAISATFYLNLGSIVLLYWLLPLFFVFPLVQRIRSVSEHFALPLLNEETSSRNIVPSFVEAFLLSPHNVNYHLLHHTQPHIPFYQLPQKFRQQASTGYKNTSYVFPYRGSVLRDLIHGPQMLKGVTAHERL